MILAGIVTWVCMVNLLAWSGHYDPEAVQVALRILTLVVVGGLPLYYPILRIVWARRVTRAIPGIVAVAASIVSVVTFSVASITFWPLAKSWFDHIFSYGYGYPTWLAAACLFGLTWCTQAAVSLLVVVGLWGRST